MLLRLRSDDQLVALFRLGNDDAFRVIHDRYRARLLAYARQMLGGSRVDAEDALQDVFLRAYHALRSDGRPVTLRAWLYRVAHNRCIDELRRGGPAAGALSLAELAVDRADPSDEVQQRETLRRLIADVRRLPEQQRSALLMREMEGLTYQELAGALDVTVPAVKSLLVRARMGLVEAQTARDTACADIRADLAGAHDRGVRASGRTRRHLRDCAPCRDYRAGLKGLERDIAALAPSGGPWGGLAKLLGLGGAGGATAGGGAMAGGGAAAGGGVLAGGAAAVTTAKVAAVVCCAALVGGGAVDATRHAERTPAPPTGARAAHATAAAPREAFSRVLAPLAAAAGPQLRRAAAAAPAHHAATRRAAVVAVPVAVHRDPSGALGAESDDDRAAQAQAGGLLGPEDDAPATEQPTTTEPATAITDDDLGEATTATSSTSTPPPSTVTTNTPDPAAAGAPAAP